MTLVNETSARAPRPEGVVFANMVESRRMGSTLYKRTLSLDLTQGSSLKLGEPERLRMKKYEKPEVTMWSSTNKDEEFPPKQTLVILNGLASNPDQLENEGASLVHNLMKELGDNAKHVNIVSISCPGFGGSGLTREVIENEIDGPKNTGVNEYVEMTKIW